MPPILDLDFMIRSFPVILQYLPMTLLITLVSCLLGLVVAFIVAIIRYFDVPVLSSVCKLYISFIRGTPTLVQLFLIYYGLPIVLLACNEKFGTDFNVSGVDKIVYALFAFSLNTGAFMSETIRSAILSVDRGQLEACYSVNMSTRQAMIRVILPQALAVALPALGNSFISTMKETSLAFSIGIVELLAGARLLGARNSRYFEVYVDAAILYWMSCIILEFILALMEKYLRKHERHPVR